MIGFIQLTAFDAAAIDGLAVMEMLASLVVIAIDRLAPSRAA